MVATLVLSLETEGWYRQVYRDAVDTTRVDVTSTPYYAVVHLERNPCAGMQNCTALPDGVFPAGDVLTVESLHKDCSEGHVVGLRITLPLPVSYLLFYDDVKGTMVGAGAEPSADGKTEWAVKLPSGRYWLVRESVPPVLLELPTSVATRGGPLTLEYSEAVRIAPGKGTVVLRPQPDGPLSTATLYALGPFVQLQFAAPLLAATVYTAQLPAGVVTDMSLNSAAPLLLEFSTPGTLYGPGSARLRLHGVGGWKQWRVKNFELFADDACSDPYAYSFSPVDWRACYPIGGLPSLMAAYAIGGLGPLYQAALEVTPAPTSSPTPAPTDPPPPPFTKSPTPSPTSYPTAFPTTTAAPTPAPTYPVECVSDCQAALLLAAVQCTASPENWPSLPPEDFGLCYSGVSTNYDTFCPDDLDGLSEEHAYFCFFSNSQCEERCAISARCPNDDIIGLGYTPTLYSADFGVDERDMVAVGGCAGLVKSARVDFGVGCTDDVSTVGPPGLVAGTTLCQMCCSACEAIGDLCSPARGAAHLNGLSLHPRINGIVAAPNPYSPPTSYPTPMPTSNPTPVPTAVPTPARRLAWAKETEEFGTFLAPRPPKDVQPPPPWLKVATHSREMVKAKSCYHLCFQSSLTLSSCSISSLEEPVKSGSAADVLCRGPRQSVVPMKFSCVVKEDSGSFTFACTSPGGVPEPLVFTPLTPGSLVQDLPVSFTSGGDSFMHRRLQSSPFCDGFNFDADRVYETSTALCVQTAAECEEMCNAVDCGCFEFQGGRCRLGTTEAACRKWADFVTPLAASCDDRSFGDSTSAALYLSGKNA